MQESRDGCNSDKVDKVRNIIYPAKAGSTHASVQLQTCISLPANRQHDSVTPHPFVEPSQIRKHALVLLNKNPLIASPSIK